MNFFPPNVTAIASSVQIGSSLAFSSLIEASDLDGNEIVSYRFRDNDAAATSGFFTIRGVRQPSNIFIEFDQDGLEQQYTAQEGSCNAGVLIAICTDC